VYDIHSSSRLRGKVITPVTRWPWTIRVFTPSTNCSAPSSEPGPAELLGPHGGGDGVWKGSFERGFPGMRGQKRGWMVLRGSADAEEDHR